MKQDFLDTFHVVDAALSNFDPLRRAPSEGLQVLDLFSGCGGMSLGFRAYADAFGGIGKFSGVDIFRQAVETYRINLGNASLGDVRKIAQARDIEGELGVLCDYDPRTPTILIGCPPCQGFSAHTRTRGGPDDDRNSLILDFARIALALKPIAIVIENVPEMLAGRYRAYWECFEAELLEGGYHFTADIHNLAVFGVPQKRNRALCFALKGPSHPLPAIYDRWNFRNVRDAIGDLPAIVAGERCSTDPMHRTVRHRLSTLEVINQVPFNGGSRPPGVGPKCLDRVSGFYDVYGRLAWNRPSITITRYSRSPASGRFTHPEQTRGLSAREVARIQTFPDRFTFSGSLDDVYRQIGEAVPPRAAVAVATWIMLHLRLQQPQLGPLATRSRSKG